MLVLYSSHYITCRTSSCTVYISDHEVCSEFHICGFALMQFYLSVLETRPSRDTNPQHPILIVVVTGPLVTTPPNTVYMMYKTKPNKCFQTFTIIFFRWSFLLRTCVCCRTALYLLSQLEDRLMSSFNLFSYYIPRRSAGRFFFQATDRPSCKRGRGVSLNC